MHELHIIIKVKLSSFKCLLFILDIIWEFNSLLFFYVDIHFWEINFLFLLQKFMNWLLLFLDIVKKLHLSNALTLNFLSFWEPCAGTAVMKSLSDKLGFYFLKIKSMCASLKIIYSRFLASYYNYLFMFFIRFKPFSNWVYSGVVYCYWKFGRDVKNFLLSDSILKGLVFEVDVIMLCRKKWFLSIF